MWRRRPRGPCTRLRIPEPEDPADDKEPYAAIAAQPGLAWKAAVASLVAGGLIGAELGWAWLLVYLIPLVPVGVALAIVDWRTLLLPTKVIRPTYALVVVGVLVCWVATATPTTWCGRAGASWCRSGCSG